MMENRMMTGNRVDCLYRVSTDKQVDYNDKSQADIPMQRRECHRFCEKMGWTIVHEEQEDGVSGHKVRAETGTSCKLSKSAPSRGNSIFCLCSCLTASGVSLMKRPLW